MCAACDWLSGLFFSQLNLPSESCLLAVLCAPADFQHLDSCIPWLAAWIWPLGQNAGTSEANCESASRYRPFTGWCNLYVSSSPCSGSALPFQDQNPLLQISLLHFFGTFLVLAQPKPVYVSVHYSLNVCHAINCFMTFPIVSITNILEGKA